MHRLLPFSIAAAAYRAAGAGLLLGLFFAFLVFMVGFVVGPSAGMITQTATTSADTLALRGLIVSVTDRAYGAVGDGVTDDTVACQAAITAVEAAGGGRVVFPPGSFLVTPQGAGAACLQVTADNVTLEGYGRQSKIITASDAHVPIHICTQPDTTQAAGAHVNGCRCKNLTVIGTGHYAYYPLASGRGILARNAHDLVIDKCNVFDMSMIGICVEGGDAYVNVLGCYVDNCGYTGINFNGRGHQSIIGHCIVTRCLGSTNSVLIQVSGHCVVSGCTAWSSSGYGIVWGEGNYHGTGNLTANLVKNTAHAGILCVYHGPVTMTANVVVNCLGGGVWLQPGVVEGYTVEQQHCTLSGNIFVNNYPYDIASYTARSTIVGNTCVYIASPVNDTSDPTDVGHIAAGNRTEVSIICFGGNSTVTGNGMDGAQYGVSIPFGDATTVVHGNTIEAQIARYFFAAPHSQYSPLCLTNYYSSDGNRQQFWVTAGAFAPSIPAKKGDVCWTLAPSAGSPWAWPILWSKDTAVATAALTGATKIYLDSTAALAEADTIQIELTTYSLHTSTIASVGSDGGGDFVVIADALPVGAGAAEDAYVSLLRYGSMTLDS